MENQSNTELHNQEDVNPGSQLDKIIREEKLDNSLNTNGTGSNRPVETESTVIIKEDNDEELDED
jgi:hypothetical protein